MELADVFEFAQQQNNALNVKQNAAQSLDEIYAII